MALRRQLNAVKAEQFPWMLEVTKNAPQIAIIQLGAAFKNFFAGRAKYPKFRRKGVHDRFSLTNDPFSVDTPDSAPLPRAENQGAVGVDLGLSALATLSTGEKIEGPKAHKALLCRLQRLSRGLSRKIKGSANRNKAKMKLSRLHARIANIRQESRPRGACLLVIAAARDS
jgi:putative transposase